MSKDSGGISQSISGGTMYGGMQAAQGENNEQKMDTHASPSSDEKQLSQEDAVKILAKIQQILNNSAELPEDVKEEAAMYLGAAQKAVEKEQPKKDLAAMNLKSMADTIETASKSVESSKKVWENIKPLLAQLPSWLGVAMNFFGF